MPLGLGALFAAAGLGLLAVSHDQQVVVGGFYLLLSIGIGLAFAAMPNLIIRAVPQERTGEATGFNAVVRSVGASLGAQVTASVLTASAEPGSSLPTDGGFTEAFAISAGIAVLAGLFTLLIPTDRRNGRPTAPARPEPALAEAG